MSATDCMAFILAALRQPGADLGATLAEARRRWPALTDETLADVVGHAGATLAREAAELRRFAAERAAALTVGDADA